MSRARLTRFRYGPDDLVLRLCSLLFALSSSVSMMSWLSRHRPRRRGAQKSTTPSQTSEKVAAPEVHADLRQRPLALRPRRRGTDDTLVDESDSGSEHTFFDADPKYALTRCASPDSFDSPKEKAPLPSSAPRGNPDDPSLWKKSQESGQQCFGPVPLDCEPAVKVHRSQWSKFASGTTHSISTILQTSIVVGEASNVPYLKGLAGIILLVSNSVQATEDNEVDCIQLQKMVLELASVAARQEEQVDEHQLSSLNRACTRILQALKSCSKQSYTRRFFQNKNDKELLLACERELQHCLDVFQVRSHIATSVALKRKDTADEAFEDQVIDVLLPVKGLLAPELASPVSDVTVFSDEPDEVELPPMPEIFYGRDSELSELVDMFSKNGQAHAVIFGQGGAGKSALSLALLHQPEIERNFLQRRFLVKCGSVEGSSALLSRLAEGLGLDITDKQMILDSLACSPAQSLIVFDDLDAAWDPPSSRLEVEDLLTQLSNIPTVSLLLTLRGTQRPLGPAYTKPYPAPLGPISPLAACQHFFAISDVPEDGENAPLVDVLLHMVGYLPSAITLLAQLAQYEPLPFLIERYREEGTSMLYHGEANMEESIEASLYSARVGECPAALEVLGILARFSDGALKTEVSALVVQRGIPRAVFSKCLSVLHKTSLVVVVAGADAQQQEKLKVPEVVRTYLERHFLENGRFRSIEVS